MSSASLYHLFYAAFDQQKILNHLKSIINYEVIKERNLQFKCLGEGRCFKTYAYRNYGYQIDYALLVEKKLLHPKSPFQEKSFSQREKWLKGMRLLSLESQNRPLIPPMEILECNQKIVIIQPLGEIIPHAESHEKYSEIELFLKWLTQKGYTLKDTIQLAQFKNEVFIHDFSDLTEELPSIF